MITVPGTHTERRSIELTNHRVQALHILDFRHDELAISIGRRRALHAYDGDGAVLIDGPKALGKKRTVEEIAGTVLRMDVDRSARAALEVAPEQLFASPTPIVSDEWQTTPELWNLARRAVVDRDGNLLLPCWALKTPPQHRHHQLTAHC